MKTRVVAIVVWRGKAYLPNQVRYESGIRADAEPVFAANLTVEDLVSAAERVLAAGEPSLPDPTREQWQNRKDPVLKATNARSWKELARSGALYVIGLADNGIRLDISRLDKKGRWEFDPEKVHTFSPRTPLPDIMAIIVEDIRSRIPTKAQ